MSPAEFANKMLMKNGLTDTECEQYYKECDVTPLFQRKTREFRETELPNKFDW